MRIVQLTSWYFRMMSRLARVKLVQPPYSPTIQICAKYVRHKKSLYNVSIIIDLCTVCMWKLYIQYKLRHWPFYTVHHTIISTHSIVRSRTPDLFTGHLHQLQHVPKAAVTIPTKLLYRSSPPLSWFWNTAKYSIISCWLCTSKSGYLQHKDNKFSAKALDGIGQPTLHETYKLIQFIILTHTHTEVIHLIVTKHGRSCK